jgi:endoglucanase
MKHLLNFLLSLFLLLMISCDKEAVNTLTASDTQFEFPPSGGTEKLILQTDAPSWKINHTANNWLDVSPSQGSQPMTEISLTVQANTSHSRTDTLKLTAGNAAPVFVIVYQAENQYIYLLQTDQTTINMGQKSATASLKISTTAPAWDIQNSHDWIQLNQTNGTAGSTTIQLTTTDNNSINTRAGLLTLKGAQARDVQVFVYQKGKLFPNYNTDPIAPDANGMSSSAVQLAWGNPMITPALIQLVRQSGFNAVRIPCSWNQHLENSETAKIKLSWLNRVREVVQFCVDHDMYVLLNIHWDGGWLENNVTPEKQEVVNARQKALWEQIATHLRDFDEHLIFAGANEPNVDNAGQMTVLQTYHQSFVDAVRSTGGKNAYRVLTIQGPSTDIEKTYNFMHTLPQDPVADRMMIEIHYYTPYQFCLMEADADWGKMFYYWGKDFHSPTDPTRNANWGEEVEMEQFFGLMKTKFVDKGIPVILGEFAVIKRTFLTGEALTLHLASRAHYLNYLTKKAKANGLMPFYWDAGNMGANASALFNRQNNTVFDQQALDAIITGARK